VRSTYRDSVHVERPIQHIVTTCRGAGVVAGLVVHGDVHE
jgi:hypothetical protein